ncbi:MAG: TraB/GumN family protein [Sphingomicrobium sp.]
MTPLPAIEAAPAVEADPALYVVRDEDTTIYLFGTFHILSANLDWFNGPIENAFAGSNELVVETLPVESADVAPAAAMPGPTTQITPAASFLASTQHAVRAGGSRGMALANGADMVLLRAAAVDGKYVEPLETLQSQSAMIARIPAEARSRAACAADACPDSAQDLPAAMTLLQGAWASGDHGLLAAMLNEMRVSSPHAYRILFTERNGRWSNWVSARMRQPGTVFVAVGAAHLVGPDSLLVGLARRGLISRRVHDVPRSGPDLAFTGPLD